MIAAQARRGDVIVTPRGRMVVESVWQMHDDATGAHDLALGLYDPETDERERVMIDAATVLTLEGLGGPR